MEWNNEPEFPNHVARPAVACALNTIYMLDATIPQNQFLSLDVEKKTWVKKCNSPGKHCLGARMIAFRNEVLVAGGKNKIFTRYSPSTDTWTTGNPPTLAHEHGALVCHGQKLYLLGGCAENRVEEYDEDTESWKVSIFKTPTIDNLHALSLTK